MKIKLHPFCDWVSNLWILRWLRRFWRGHGERIVFGIAAFILAVYFRHDSDAQLKGAGLTIMIGLAMECYRQARGGSSAPDEKEPEPPKE